MTISLVKFCVLTYVPSKTLIRQDECYIANSCVQDKLILRMFVFIFIFNCLNFWL